MTQLAVVSSDATWQIIVACGLLIVLLLGGFLALLHYRKKVLYSQTSAGEPWTLDDLRKMREQGSLTENEYQALRAAMIGSLAGGKSRTAGASPPVQPDAASRTENFDLEKDLGA